MFVHDSMLLSLGLKVIEDGLQSEVLRFGGAGNFGSSPDQDIIEVQCMFNVFR